MDLSVSNSAGLDPALRALRKLAPAGYSVVLHIRGLSCRMADRTFPLEWIRQYDENGYALRDPIIGWCIENRGILKWSDPTLPDPYGVMRAAAEFGIRFGASVSLGPRECRSVVSISRSDREPTDGECEEMAHLSNLIHQLLPMDVELTRKQIDALRCIAEGMRMKQAAALLGISESALKMRIGSARAKLNARTTAEAVQRAKDYELI